MIPVGKEGSSQFIYLIDKDENGKVKSQVTLSVSYVPLTSKEKQLGYK
jgi:protein-L-isoaspartate O-methyltransferase